MTEGQVEQSGIDRSQNNIIDLAAVRQKRAEEKRPPGTPAGEIAGKPAIEAGTSPSLPQTQERAGVIDFGEVRNRRDDAWVYDLLRKRFSRENRADLDREWNLTDEEWQRVERVNSNLYENMRLTNRQSELKKQADGNKAVFQELWQKELTLINEQERRKREEQEIKNRKVPTDNVTREDLAKRFAEVGYKPLTDEQWRERERMKGVDPTTLSKEQWEAWSNSFASTTLEMLEEIKEFNKLTEARRSTEREKREALGWKGDLGDLGDAFYTDVVLENAQKLGLDPHTLTAEQRKELRSYQFLTERERKLKAAQIMRMKMQPPRRFQGNGSHSNELGENTGSEYSVPPGREFAAFQEWFWSLPLDVVIMLWERGQQNMQAELEPPMILESIRFLYTVLRDTVKKYLSKPAEGLPKQNLPQ